ncbi:MAG TPA: DNA replication/repair protein RecF [Clostridiales bacterium]|jgi:DNA replication and repair protein RecF|nr:DNA replication/repair protein RecF [Clostridiales bacterium]
MICRRVRLENFRNIAAAEVGFCEGVNIFIGENGAGKTNLIEAVCLASIGKSHRGAGEDELINFGAQKSFVSVDFSDSIREQNISVLLERGRRRQVELNRVSLRKLSDMVGTFNTVLFCPEHLSIIKDGPSARRNYLDVAISQLRPVYVASLQRYNHILKQRNKLIRYAKEDRRTFDETIDFWSEQLADEAAIIASIRAEFVKRAGGCVAVIFSEMTGDREIPGLKYIGSSKDEEDFYFDRKAVKNRYMELLSSSHEREIAAECTLWGIHKDDIEVTLNGRPARIFASQGQQRSLSLALKLTEGEICREVRGEYPVFLLDDVLSELDEGRRKYLMGNIGSRQVIITTCEPTSLHGARIIYVKNGSYEVFGN